MRIRWILFCALVILTCSPCDSKLLLPSLFKETKESSLQQTASPDLLSTSDRSSQAQCPAANADNHEHVAEAQSAEDDFLSTLHYHPQADHQYCHEEGPAPLHKNSACHGTLTCPQGTDVQKDCPLHSKVPAEYQDCTQCAGTLYRTEQRPMLMSNCRIPTEHTTGHTSAAVFLVVSGQRHRQSNCLDQRRAWQVRTAHNTPIALHGH